MPTEVDTATEDSTVEEAPLDSLSLAQLLTSDAPPEPDEAVTEEAEAETELEEAQPEAEEQEALETEQEQPEPQPDGKQKRIDKLTAQKSELKEKIASLEDQLKQASESKPATPENQIQNITSISELERVEQEAIQNELWAKQQQKLLGRDPEKVSKNLKELFGAEPDDPEQFLDELELAAVELQRSKLPQARKRIELTNQWDVQAEQIYPWVNDPEDQNGAVIQDVLKKFGDLRLREIPMHKIMLARMVGGAIREREAAQKKAAPKPKAQPTPQPGKPAGGKPRKVTSQEKADAAAKRVREGGGRAALAELIRAGAYQEQ